MYMETTAINKPVYDALISVGVSEEKAEAAAKAVLPSIDSVATKSDIGRVESKINMIMWIMSVGFAVLILDAVQRLIGA